MKFLTPLFLILVLMGCQPHEDVNMAINERMKQQELAWNEGNLEGFMAAYDPTDSLMFIGKSGLTYGWKSTLENYKKGYPDRAAMGKLKFTNVKLSVLDENNAFLVGKWELFRISDTLSGHYSLLWQKKQGQWFIVADHSS